MEMRPENWHNLEATEAITSLQSSNHGLSQEEAQKRLAQFGPNELVAKKKISPWAIFIQQFKSILIIILLTAVVLSATLGEIADAILIGVIVFFACGLGFIKVSAEYPPACWRDESGLVRNLVRGGSPSRNAPQLAVGYFTWRFTLSYESAHIICPLT